jgi:hypothetical protein
MIVPLVFKLQSNWVSHRWDFEKISWTAVLALDVREATGAKRCDNGNGTELSGERMEMEKN